MKPLVLTGSIPGLLRRGSPVHVSLASDAVIQGVYLFGRVVCQDGGLMDWYDIGEGSEDVAPGEVALDLADPTGRYHALLWLRERGHDLAWAEGLAEVLAWSVVSVSRGGGVILAVGGRWMPQAGVGSKGWIRLCAASAAGSHVSPGTPNRVGSGLVLAASISRRTAADHAALTARYALRQPDGALVLPELLEIPNV